jgi:3-oxoacyl-[acyl-carrier-protein] synthase II
MRRVVVTGLGVVSSVGVGVDAFWRGLSQGRSGIRRISKFDPSPFPSQIAGEVADFAAADHLPRRDVVRTDAFIHYAMAAAYQAQSDAKLDVSRDAERTGVSIGTGLAGIPMLTAAYDTLVHEGPGVVTPYVMPGFLANMAAGWVSIRLGARGPIAASAAACAAGSQAIGDGYRIIQHGEADAMIVGGAEAPITPIVLAAFGSLRALSTCNADPEGASRPFDKARDGFVLAEGAGILVLEERQRALERGAQVYAEIVGYAVTADAHHPTAPSVEGSARAMRRALDDAALRAEDVDYINAHGTSTPYNDLNETRAIKQVFGEHAGRLAVSSTKSMIGHLIGAAGAVEAVASVLAIARRLIPPTINYETVDPECDLDYVPNRARPASPAVVMSNSFAFGGFNAALLFRRHPD